MSVGVPTRYAFLLALCVGCNAILGNEEGVLVGSGGSPSGGDGGTSAGKGSDGGNAGSSTSGSGGENAGGQGGEDSKGSGHDTEQFVGLWTQTHGSFTGTCLGTLETEGAFLLRFRATPNGEIEFVQLDQSDLSIELWTVPFAVQGAVATTADTSPHSVEPGETDPITLQRATDTTLITFTSDRFEASAGRLHEIFEATRETGATTCTFNGTADYERI